MFKGVVLSCLLLVVLIFDARCSIFPQNQPLKKEKEYHFIWGAQYYRAPTPEPEVWEADFQKMQEMGFNQVKFWVQWRWSHIEDNIYDFDDLEQLLALADKYNIKVTLNTIFDVTPHWLFDKYPDAKQITNNGRPIEPYTVGHRQIGGHPGPCYNHPGALKERKKFMEEAIKKLSQYKSLEMWDVWNEPELSYQQRSPIVTENLVCYCHHCKAAFKDFLKQKYTSLHQLNKIWGRNYQNWDQVELPKSGSTITDFIDWREFHSATMTQEAKWRIDMVHRLDPGRVAFLHVVPNTMNPFNAISTCTDDFEMAEMCDVFASTMNAGPYFTPQVVSAARGKTCYNVESHINAGSTSVHQKVIDEKGLLKDFIPQIGLGIKGFMFWQFRPEVLGVESPSWGLVNLDGSDREITKAARIFNKKLEPYKKALMDCSPKYPEIGIWKSKKNEIFQFCIHNNLNKLIENVNGYAKTLYWNSYQYRYISEKMLANNDLDSLKILIMPSAYYLTQEEANSLVKWVINGGVLLAEAHLGAYNGSTGRHSRTIPGCGLNKAFGITESLSTSSYHLKLETSEVFTGAATPDAKKAFESLGISGGKFYPIINTEGNLVWGADRYAELTGENLTNEAYFEGDKPCAVNKKVGKGYIYYYATRLGIGASKASQGLVDILEKVCNKANIKRTMEIEIEDNAHLRIDKLNDKNQKPRFFTIQNRESKEVKTIIIGKGNYKGIFTGTELQLNGKTPLNIEANFTELFVKTGN